MTTGCVGPTTITSGSQLTGLTGGTPYYVTVSASASTGYLASAPSTVAGPETATTQLTHADRRLPRPTARSRARSRSPSPLRRTPRAVRPTPHYACTNAGMTTGVRRTAVDHLGRPDHRSDRTAGLGGHRLLRDRHGRRLDRLPRYRTSTDVGPQNATSQVNAPTGVTPASSTTTAGAITATFTASTGTAPSSYTATACTNAGMSTGCVTQTGYTSGAQITGLTAGHSATT